MIKMKEIILDGNLIETNSHEYIKNKLNFPDYYGNNLDALFDCLGDISFQCKITIINSQNLDSSLIDTFKDGESENPLLSIEFK